MTAREAILTLHMLTVLMVKRTSRLLMVMEKCILAYTLTRPKLIAQTQLNTRGRCSKAHRVLRVFPEAMMCHTHTFSWAHPQAPRKATCGGMGQRLTMPQHYSITMDQLGWTKVSSKRFLASKSCNQLRLTVRPLILLISMRHSITLLLAMPI
ncbi:hypothetical protein FAM18113_02166 [Lacticaseibacillus paracasei]|nr:hypothetical protein FAM18113_02166 [Lacticaseibacillus paracasei]